MPVLETRLYKEAMLTGQYSCEGLLYFRMFRADISEAGKWGALGHRAAGNAQGCTSLSDKSSRDAHCMCPEAKILGVSGVAFRNFWRL